MAGHSSEPIGPSAIHELVEAIGRMLSDGWGKHELYGNGSINFGNIDGGLAANVVAPHASATLLVRAPQAERIALLAGEVGAATRQLVAHRNPARDGLSPAARVLH